jgi:hypothetical protein
MPIKRRIYVSLPADPWLPENINRLKWGIVEEIEKLGYIPETAYAQKSGQSRYSVQNENIGVSCSSISGERGERRVWI